MVAVVPALLRQPLVRQLRQPGEEDRHRLVVARARQEFLHLLHVHQLSTLLYLEPRVASQAAPGFFDAGRVASHFQVTTPVVDRELIIAEPIVEIPQAHLRHWLAGHFLPQPVQVINPFTSYFLVFVAGGELLRRRLIVFQRLRHLPFPQVSQPVQQFHHSFLLGERVEIHETLLFSGVVLYEEYSCQGCRVLGYIVAR